MGHDARCTQCVADGTALSVHPATERHPTLVAPNGETTGAAVVTTNKSAGEIETPLVHIKAEAQQRKGRNKVSLEEAKKNRVEGTVTLKVTFLKDGTIGDISVVKSVSKELDESAIKAAKLIRFEPERKKGKPLTITRSIQYSFTLY